MIYGFLTTGGPLAMDLNIPKYVSKYEKYGNSSNILTIFGKEGNRTIMKIRLNKSSKSWIWDQYPPEDVKRHFGIKTFEAKKLLNLQLRNLYFWGISNSYNI